MSRFSLSALIAAALATLMLAGCGGGGGGTGAVVNPPPATGRDITATVVSSTGGRGVDGIAVRFMSSESVLGSGVSANGGKVTIHISSSVILPDRFTVDPSGAGSTFPLSELVTYNAQTYYPDRVDTPKSILNGVSNDLGTITVKEVTDPSQPPGSAYPDKDTVITGRVVSKKTGAGISGVEVSFGFTPAKVDTTGAKGYFAINLGRNASVLDVYLGHSVRTFSVNTAGLPGASSQVIFNSVRSYYSSIVVPDDLLNPDVTSLGTIEVVDDGSGDDVPPPPSFP